MKTIWKYELETTDDQYFEMPIGEKPLSVGVQRGVPCLWVLVNPNNPMAQVHVKIFGTGNPVSAVDMRFVGTYQLRGGDLVFHVFVD